MTQFCIWQQLAIDKDRGPDAGSDCDQDNDAFAAFANAKLHLRQTRSIRIVDHRNETAGLSGENFFNVDSYPLLIDVGSGARNPFVND